MTNPTITKEEIMAIYPKVAETMADALGRDVAEMSLDASLIDDLGYLPAQLEAYLPAQLEA